VLTRQELLERIWIITGCPHPAPWTHTSDASGKSWAARPTGWKPSAASDSDREPEMAGTSRCVIHRPATRRSGIPEGEGAAGGIG